MNNSKKYISIYLSGLIIASTSLFANKEINELNEVTIMGVENSSYLSQENPSFNRANIPLEDMPKNVQIYNEEFLKDAHIQGIEDIVKMSSNTTYQGNNHGRSIEIGMRGFSDVPILVDSMKMTNTIANQEIFNLESIEILKGPDSLQYGQSSPGGLVNIVKKKPQKETHAQLELDLSDNSLISPKIDIGGSINDKTRYRLVSVYKYDEGFTNANVDTKRIFMAPSLAYDINDDHTLTLMAEYTNETTPSSFGTYVDSNGNLVAPIDIVSSHPDEEFEKTQKVIGFDLESHLGTWSSNLKYRYIDINTENGNVHIPNYYNESTGILRRFYADQTQEFSEQALQYTLNKELTLFDMKNKISLGADYNKAYSQTGMFYDTGTAYNIDLSNPTYEDLTTISDHPAAADYSSAKTYVKTWGAFLQDTIYITNDFILNTGLRYSESAPKNDQTSDALTPSLGFVYKFNPNTSLYANYSESFSPNTNKDKNGKVLEPEVGSGYELGIKQKFFDDALQLTAAVFKIEKENVALSDDSTVSTTDYIASGKQESQGFELDIMGQITPDWSVMASYGYTTTKDRDNDNNELRNIPNHTANIFTTYYLSSWGQPNYYIGGGARYLGNRYADTSNNIQFDSEVIYNATIGYKKGNWKANLSVQNLTDEEYVEGALASNAAGTRVYTGNPRTIMATISYNF